MRTHVLARLAWLVLSCVELTTACGAPGPTRPEIEAVVAVRGGENALALRITGRGFGLQSLSFDLDTGRGEIRPSPAVGILTGDGDLVHLVSSDEIVWVSTHEMVAHVVRSTPIPSGFYRIAMLVETTIITEHPVQL